MHIYIYQTYLSIDNDDLHRFTSLSVLAVVMYKEKILSTGVNVIKSPYRMLMLMAYVKSSTMSCAVSTRRNMVRG